MTVIATASNPRFTVSRVDIDRPGPTYTIDTLRDLRAERPDDELFFITGADALAEILSWKDAEHLWELAHFIGVTRPGHELSDKGLPEDRVTLQEVPAMAISSTDCRARVAGGEPVWYLVPDGVVQYINKYRLYTGAPCGAPPVEPLVPRVAMPAPNAASSQGDSVTAADRSLQLAKVAALAAEEKIAEKVMAIDVSDQMPLTDVFVIASAPSERQVGAIVDEVEDRLRELGSKPIRREGEREGRWVLIDFGDIIVHVQHEEEREYYALERLWKDCPEIDLAHGRGPCPRPGQQTTLTPAMTARTEPTARPGA